MPVRSTFHTQGLLKFFFKIFHFFYEKLRGMRTIFDRCYDDVISSLRGQQIHEEEFSCRLNCLFWSSIKLILARSSKLVKYTDLELIRLSHVFWGGCLVWNCELSDSSFHGKVISLGMYRSCSHVKKITEGVQRGWVYTTMEKKFWEMVKNALILSNNFRRPASHEKW